MKTRLKAYFFIIFFLLTTHFSIAQKVVVIDAGHGGKDPGAIGKNSREKNVVLDIALMTGEYLEKNVKNIKVIYTRKKDVFVPLEERASIANKANADLFVSIHANSIKNRKACGTETYIMGTHKTEQNLEVAVLENSAILYEKDYLKKYSGYDPKSPESYILMNLYQSAYRDMSIDLAQKIQTQFKTRAGRKDKGVKQAGFLVLWRTTMPSVLVEVGFISNRSEENFLNSEYGKSIIASAIYRAIRDFLNENE